MTKETLKKALLLFNRHRDFIDDNYNQKAFISELIDQNNPIDAEMKHEKAKSNHVKNVFLWIDIFLSILIPFIEVVLYFLFFHA